MTNSTSDFHYVSDENKINMWDTEAYPNGDFGFSWFFFYRDDIPGWSRGQLEA